MTATGFTRGQVEAMLADARANKQIIDNAGQDTIQNYSALTSEAMQGGAAEATQQTAAEIQRISQEADQIVVALERAVQNFGENMAATDARGQANILG